MALLLLPSVSVAPAFQADPCKIDAQKSDCALEGELKKLGYYPDTPPDGRPESTVAAIKGFQNALHKLGYYSSDPDARKSAIAANKQFQIALQKLVSYSGTPNGYFGPTVTAVIAFQKELNTLGYTGPSDGSLDSMIAALAKFQSALQTLGYYTDTAHGRLDPTIDAIKKLQGDLKTLSPYTGPQDGHFSSTINAIISLQKKLNTLGYYTEATDGRLNPTIAAVRTLQEALVTLGYLGTPDGHLGPTSDAIRRFQRKLGIAPDGSLSDQTVNELKNLIQKASKPQPKTQTFTIPGLVQPIDYAALVPWLVLTLISLATTVLLAIALRRMRASRSALQPAVEQFGHARSLLADIQEDAIKAAAQYDRALRRLKEPPAAPQPLSAPVSPATVFSSAGSSGTPEPPYVPGSGSPTRSTSAMPSPAECSSANNPSVLAQYQRIRAGGASDRDIDTFENTYGHTRISCTNLDDLRVNPKAVLEFVEDPRGALFMVRQGASDWVFPWFTTNLRLERSRLEGVFRFDDNLSGNLQVAKAALLDTSRSPWVLKEKGVIQADA